MVAVLWTAHAVAGAAVMFTTVSHAHWLIGRIGYKNSTAGLRLGIRRINMAKQEWQRSMDSSEYQKWQNDKELIDREGYNANWDEIWDQGVPPGQGWDLSDVAPPLKRLVQSGALDLNGKRVVVPGCGRGYDVLLFANQGASAIGLEISETAVKAASDYRDSLTNFKPMGRATFTTGNFFEYEPSEGAFDFGYDYTFFCAIHPSMRDSWAKTWSKLITKGGELVTLIFPADPSLDCGPPFYTDPQVVKKLLESNGFECKELNKVDPALSHPERAGYEYLGRWTRI